MRKTTRPLQVSGATSLRTDAGLTGGAVRTAGAGHRLRHRPSGPAFGCQLRAALPGRLTPTTREPHRHSAPSAESSRSSSGTQTSPDAHQACVLSVGRARAETRAERAPPPPAAGTPHPSRPAGPAARTHLVFFANVDEGRDAHGERPAAEDTPLEDHADRKREQDRAALRTTASGSVS